MKKSIKKSLYTGQLQGCNAVHILAGVISIALAMSQFSKIHLANYNQIDFRLLNFIHILTGSVGIFMVKKNYGSIAAKTMYNVSIVLGIFTAYFYVDTIISVVKQYNEVRDYASKAGGTADGYADEENYYVGKIAVCAVMIAVGIIETLVGFISDSLLDKLVTHYAQNATTLGQQQQLRRNRSRLTLMAFLSLLVALAIIGTGVHLEYLYKKLQKIKFIPIALQELAGSFVCSTAIVELFALFSKKHNLLNFKASLAIAIVSATIGIKTIDYMVSFYLRNDIDGYNSHRKLDDSASVQGESFVKLLMHSLTILLLSISFFLCIFSAVQAGSCVERSYGIEVSQVDKKISRIRNCFGIFHVVFGLFMLALSILSFVSVENWSKSYDGSSLFAIGLLVIATGVTSAGQIRTLAASTFVLSVTTLTICLENCFYSIHQLVLAITSDHDSQQEHIGAIVLYSCQSGFLLAEFLHCIAHSVTFSKVIKNLKPQVKGHDNVLACISSLHLFYLIVALAAAILSEISLSLSDGTPGKQQFSRMTHAPFMMIKLVIVIIASKQANCLLNAAVLQLISAAIAFVALPIATTSLYYFYVMYQDDITSLISDIESQNKRRLYLQIAIGVTAANVLACMVEICISVVSALRISDLVHHRFYPKKIATIPVPPRSKALVPSAAAEWSGESPYYYYRHPYHQYATAKPRQVENYSQTYMRHPFQNGYNYG